MTLHLVEGQDFSADYTLDSRLDQAQGRSKIVETWLGTDLHLREKVVLTVFTAPLDEASSRLIGSGTEQALGLIHPNIVRPQALLSHDGHHYVVSKFVDAAAPLVMDHDNQAAQAALIKQLFDAVTFAHRLGVAHGHIHPGNLLVDKSGTLHITGFGLSATGSVDSPGNDYLSPQAKASPGVADRSDDIYSCGQVLAVMLTGKPWRAGEAFETQRPVPAEIQKLVMAMLSTSPWDRPRDLEEIGQSIQRFLSGSSAIEIDESFMRASPSSLHVAPRADTHRPTRESRLMPASVAYIALLLVIAAGFGLFLVLPEAEPADYRPDLTEQVPRAEPIRAAVVPDQEPVQVLTPLERARLAQLEADSEAAAKEFLRLQITLEDLGVNLWGRTAFEAALSYAEEADTAYREDRFEQSFAAYQAGIEQLATLRDRAPAVRDDNLVAGRTALADSEAEDALKAYTIVLAIEADNEEAQAGVTLAENLSTLNGLLADAAFQQSEGNLVDARAKILEARRIDAAWQPASDALAEVEALIAAEKFNDAMSRALTALAAERFDEARTAFEAAQQILPDSSEPGDGLEQVNVAVRMRALNELRTSAAAQVETEDWPAAISTYEELLGMESSLVFANEGLENAKRRLELDEALERVLAHPTLLASDAELSNAKDLLVDASRLETRGPRLDRQLDDLSLHISLARIPMPVELKSDNKTDITVYRVGALGRLETHRLELLPGQYTIVGSRRGYRDVSVDLTLIGGRPPAPVYVACTEKI